MGFPRCIISGQLFYGQEEHGPMFKVFELGCDGPYTAKVLSHYDCESVIDEVPSLLECPPNVPRPSSFATVGEAVEWCREFCEY
jgi:hypothetical protein